MKPVDGQKIPTQISNKIKQIKIINRRFGKMIGAVKLNAEASKTYLKIKKWVKNKKSNGNENFKPHK